MRRLLLALMSMLPPEGVRDIRTTKNEPPRKYLHLRGRIVFVDNPLEVDAFLSLASVSYH